MDKFRPPMGVGVEFESLEFGQTRIDGSNKGVSSWLSVSRFDVVRAGNVLLDARSSNDPILTIVPDAFAVALRNLSATPPANPYKEITQGWLRLRVCALIIRLINALTAVTPYYFAVNGDVLRLVDLEFRFAFQNPYRSRDFESGFLEHLAVNAMITVYSSITDRMLLILRGKGFVRTTSPNFISEMLDIESITFDKLVDPPTMTEMQWKISLAPFSEIPAEWKDLSGNGKYPFRYEFGDDESQFNQLTIIKRRAASFESTAQIDTHRGEIPYSWSFNSDDGFDFILPLSITRALTRARRMVGSDTTYELTPNKVATLFVEYYLQGVLVTIGLTSRVKFHPVGFNPKKVIRFHLQIEALPQELWRNRVDLLAMMHIIIEYQDQSGGDIMFFTGKAGPAVPSDLMHMMFVTMKTPDNRSVWMADRDNRYPDYWK